jgi:hypothetical protein
MRRFLTLLVIIFSGLGFAASSAQPFLPVRDVLPDAATAINVGSAILDTYFDQRLHAPNSPGYRAVLNGEVWTVYQSLPANTLGGGPTVELAKHDARVISIYLTQ